MKSTIFTLLLIAISSQTGICAEWESLFNGKDLTGWKANNSPSSFSVVDGALRVQANERTAAHLFFIGTEDESVEKFKNFELKAVVRAEPNSNSGIFIHTDMSVRNAQKHLANGYEVQLNSTKKEKRKTGSLYAIVDKTSSPVDETEWFTIRISVVDDHISVFVNDEQMVDYTEPENPQRPPARKGRVLNENGGGIALQAHDKNSIWYFKEIQVKRLP